MTTLETLKAARELISDPDRWTTKASARDAEGRHVHACDPDAVSWCALGAIVRSVGTRDDLHDNDYASNAAIRLSNALTRDDSRVATVNDEQGHAAILALFDKAIANVYPLPG